MNNISAWRLNFANTRQTVGLLLVSLAIVIGCLMIPITAWAHGSACLGGRGYRDAGTPHNYVYFEIPSLLRSRTDWHVHRPWWAFPIDLWSGAVENGVLKAGIQGTDYNPPYGPWNYSVCLP